MSRRITNAHLGWTALACLALGALTGYGLVGSISVGEGIDGSVKAAWAQAILSVVAIVVAALIPVWHDKARLRGNVDVYVDMISRAEDQASSVANYMRIGLGETIGDADQKEWTRICQVFDSIPFHNVPDYRLYSILQDAAHASEVIRDIYEPLIKSGDVVTESALSQVREQATCLRQCYEDAASISNRMR